ncbi:Hypothetical protein OINT_1000809 [Brucella intermedia LMG 3301]|uniref:Uncharacterized protein n=1 Tax=Brucella intermedia LMG 3301 TaxID=641118 RepID=C4WFR1_9HYPH|nr:Hypothetical protein OINT_1000809 [Brucella intermedia LMG 3301]
MQKGTAQRHSKPDGAQRKLFLKNLPFFRLQYSKAIRPAKSII